MSNPFGNPFASSPFGSTQSPPAYGSISAGTTPSPFGQQPLFGQSGSSVAGTPEGGNSFKPTSQLTFGQSPSPFNQSSSMAGSGFSQSVSTAFTSPASAAIVSPFGQTSGSNQNTAGKMFGASSTSAPGLTFGQSGTSATTVSPFGQSPMAPVFGQSSSTSFAQSASTASQPFGQTASSAFGQATSASPFGQAISTVSPFGQTTSSASPFGQAISTATPFGQTTSSSSPFSQTMSAASPFGQTMSTASPFGQASSTTAPFGQTMSAASPFGQTTATASPFGMASSATVPYGQNSAAAAPFIQAMSTASSFGQTASAAPLASYGQVSSTASLFGKTSASSPFGQQSVSSQLGQTSSLSTSVFGQPSSPAAPAPFSQAKESLFAQSSASSSFGQNSISTPFGQSSQFGQIPASVSSSTSLFGKTSSATSTGPSSTTATLFGKPITSANSGVFPSANSASATGLFGKPVTTTTEKGGFQPLIVKEEISTGQSSKEQSSNTAAFSSGSSSLYSNVFGIKKEDNVGVKQEKTLFGKVVDKSASSESVSQGQQSFGLFGKGQEQKPSGQFVGVDTGNLFDKGKEDYSSGGFIEKGVAKNDSQPTESKTGEKIEDHEGDDRTKEARSGKGRGNERTRLIRRLSTSNEARSPAARGLFGKPLPPGEEKREGRQPLARQLSEEVAGRVAIICKNVPTRFNTNIFMRRHFERFGTVSKVFPNSKNQQATIHFTTHKAAAEAKRRGRLLAKDVPPMTIFWSSYIAKPARGATDDDPASSATRKRGPDTGKPWKARGGLDDELASMSGTQDVGFSGSSPEKNRTVPSRSAPAQEKRQRSLSPVPTALKPGDKVTKSMFDGLVGNSAAERVNLLSLRDKYIRLYRKKQKKSDMATKAFIGMCPDMCPEKERYYREDTRQLHPFEIIPGTDNIPGQNPHVDHRRAVKEYLRSSPDQNEPLAHELRPLTTLQKTMTYLLMEVVQKGEDGRWGDWFDYLWNRTRGIRKDITQQQLCDRSAVDLIEKCARFHIFCSERLCEEDMHAFDAKINNENLTKCLQTLREFYTDLEKKHKQFCSSEAEFRAYTILMNLNQGDILREAQQLRSEVRASPEIKFALKVYFSLNNNNYIKFFRLLNEASFANACIMHRYFTQVRNRALQMMMRGYSMGKTPAQIPLKELVRLLGFEDEKEAGDFCGYYGFQVADGEVSLDRFEYIEPETAWEPRRSIKIIEAKLHVSVGEMIYGSTFPHYEPEIPRSSFDANGRFHSAIPLPGAGIQTSSAPETKTVHEVKEVPAVPVVPPVVPLVAPPPSVPQELVPTVTQEVQPPRPKFSNESVKDIAKILFGEVINEMCGGIGDEIMRDVESKLQLSTSYVDQTIQETVYEVLREISENVIEEAEETKKKELQKEKEERKKRVVDVLSEELLEDVLFQQVKDLAEDQMRQVNEELRKESEMRSTANISADIVEDVMADMVAEISEDVFETDVRQRLKQLSEFEAIVKLARTARFLEKWKKEYKAVTKLKRAMQDFPSAPNMAGVDASFKDLASVSDPRVKDGQFFISKRARLTVESAYEVSKRRKIMEAKVTMNSLYQKLLRQAAWHPLDLTRIVGRSLLNKHQDRSASRCCSTIHWKLVISLPDVGYTGDDSDLTSKHLCDWMTNKFSKGITPRLQSCTKTRAISLYRCPVGQSSAKYSSQEPGKLGICVRTVIGTLSEDDIEEIQEERHFLGTSGLMFVLPAVAQLSQQDSEYWFECKERLQGILDIKPVCQNIPLVVIVPSNQNYSDMDLLRELSLDDLVDDNVIGAVHFVKLKLNSAHPKGIDVVNPALSEQVCEGVQWLGEQTILPQRLTVRYLRDCMEDCLFRWYYTPVQQNLKHRRLLRHPDKDPHSLIELYNSVILHAATVLTADSLATISWPISEFWRDTSADLPPAHWNSEDHFDYLYSFITSLQLPLFYPQDSQSIDWRDVQTDIWTFVSTIAGSTHGATKVDFYSRVRQLLHQVEVDFEETCFLLEGEESCLPSYINVPWNQLISICIDFRLRTGDFTDPDLICMQSNVDLTEMKVAYQAEMLDEFTPPESWKYVESEKSILDIPSLDATVHIAAEKVRMQESLATPKTEVSIVEPKTISVVKTETKKESSLLLQSLTSQRRRSEKFLQFLENAVNDEPLDNTSNSFSGSSQLNGSHLVAMATNDFSMCGNQRQVSFNATSYFGQGQGNISAIFDETDEQSFPQSKISRRQSLEELSTLPGSKRLQRMSQLFGDDPVMMWLKKPRVSEDMQLLKQQLKSSRRKSDMFEKKLRQTLASE